MKAQFLAALEVFFADEPEANTENTPRAVIWAVCKFMPPSLPTRVSPMLNIQSWGWLIEDDNRIGEGEEDLDKYHASDIHLKLF
jgi:hypothetical protein